MDDYINESIMRRLKIMRERLMKICGFTMVNIETLMVRDFLNNDNRNYQKYLRELVKCDGDVHDIKRRLSICEKQEPLLVNSNIYMEVTSLIFGVNNYIETTTVQLMLIMKSR